jgi:hypothetical protein
MKYKNRTIIFYRDNVHIKILFKNGVKISCEYRISKKSKIWQHYRVSFLEKLNNKEQKLQRDKRFKNRKAIIRIRPKLRLIAIEHWETSDQSRKNILKLKTKSYIRVEISAPGELEVPARSWD